MVSNLATKFSIFALVLSTLAVGTGCSSMSAAVAPATVAPVSATSATKSDSRIAHFDRENLDRTFF